MPKFSIAPLEQRLAAGQDSVLLRVTLALAYQQQGELATAVPHLVKATELDPHYSGAGGPSEFFMWNSAKTRRRVWHFRRESKQREVMATNKLKRK
ncbi:hypothetical protein AWV79_25640 [Cupriavidus sp. UYMMa02A]|nr:hypothetical protein AWV79_25640 [Cupriavidus sp. UYMMa02A]